MPRQTTRVRALWPPDAKNTDELIIAVIKVVNITRQSDSWSALSHGFRIPIDGPVIKRDETSVLEQTNKIEFSLFEIGFFIRKKSFQDVNLSYKREETDLRIIF